MLSEGIKPVTATPGADISNSMLLVDMSGALLAIVVPPQNDSTELFCTVTPESRFNKLEACFIHPTEKRKRR